MHERTRVRVRGLVFRLARHPPFADLGPSRSMIRRYPYRGITSTSNFVSCISVSPTEQIPPRRPPSNHHHPEVAAPESPGAGRDAKDPLRSGRAPVRARQPTLAQVQKATYLLMSSPNTSRCISHPCALHQGFQRPFSILVILEAIKRDSCCDSFLFLFLFLLLFPFFFFSSPVRDTTWRGIKTSFFFVVWLDYFLLDSQAQNENIIRVRVDFHERPAGLGGTTWWALNISRPTARSYVRPPPPGTPGSGSANLSHGTRVRHHGIPSQLFFSIAAL
jgi:hypothetical protein